ncbi:MAG: hypothetical protein HY738_19350 [Bacteroidia bacterium]|nr:hypothetical protein [Bacteroidia bacterium]
MKKLLLLSLISIWGFDMSLSAQNIAITDDDSYTAHASAMLDVKSLTKGLLIPRLTTAQRTAIASPAIGLLVFDTSIGSFYFYNGTGWVNLTYGNPSNIWSQSGSNVYLTNNTYHVGVGTSAPVGKLEVKGDVPLTSNVPLFEVLNSNGDTVFAVYSQGVRVYVADDPAVKAAGSRSGFAVGGFSMTKGLTNEYLRVTPDSVRIYIEEDVVKASGSRGGFAVGGFSLTKGTYTDDYMFVADDSTRVWTDGAGGFEIRDLATGSQGYMDLNPNNYFIGHLAGDSIVSGEQNLFLGYKAGRNTTVGWNNIFIGTESGYKNTAGGTNIFFGRRAGYNSEIGNGNLFIGYEAGTAFNGNNVNTLIGYSCGSNLITGLETVFMVGYVEVIRNPVIIIAILVFMQVDIINQEILIVCLDIVPDMVRILFHIIIIPALVPKVAITMPPAIIMY